MLKSVLSRRIVVGIIGGVSGGASATAVTGLSHSEQSSLDPMGYIRDNYFKYLNDPQKLALAAEKETELEIVDDSKTVSSEYCVVSREENPGRESDSAEDAAEVRSEITTSSLSEILEANHSHFHSLATFNSLYASSLILDSPPRKEEVLGAIETIWAPPAALQPFIPQVLHKLNEEQKTELTTQIFNAVMSPEVMETLKKNIAAHEEDAIKSKPKFFQLPCESHPDFEKWEQLIQKYRCSICLDVLAAPHVTSCSHTFCWTCITEEGTKKTPNCGLCKEKISSLNYSRNEDSNICAEVANISDSFISKIEWKDRRKKFIHKKKENGSASDQSDELPTWFLALCASFIIVLILASRRYA